jgi:hypothetical protein
MTDTSNDPIAASAQDEQASDQADEQQDATATADPEAVDGEDDSSDQDESA